jgi:hypothetical protein
MDGPHEARADAPPPYPLSSALKRSEDQRAAIAEQMLFYGAPWPSAIWKTTSRPGAPHVTQSLTAGISWCAAAAGIRLSALRTENLLREIRYRALFGQCCFLDGAPQRGCDLDV